MNTRCHQLSLSLRSLLSFTIDPDASSSSQHLCSLPRILLLHPWNLKLRIWAPVKQIFGE
ncbi:hypothetical protein BS78_10G141900 [Paspalum vaginatum]|nr:hypothetical protein BS78_10G141900 [Paspalum vaginatum]